MSSPRHWDDVYSKRDVDAVSWFRPHLDRSLRLLVAAGVQPTAHLVDVGGGASTLVDDVLRKGFTEVTVLDISAVALDACRRRLGERGRGVRWLRGDATAMLLDPGSVDVWHDRAVFHFLTDTAARDAYLAHLRSALRVGGYALIATFAPDGPERCSGLPVQRYAPEEIAALLGDGFETVASEREVHVTPAGAEQAFAYLLARRIE